MGLTYDAILDDIRQAIEEESPPEAAIMVLAAQVIHDVHRIAKSLTAPQVSPNAAVLTATRREAFDALRTRLQSTDLPAGEPVLYTVDLAMEKVLKDYREGRL